MILTVVLATATATAVIVAFYKHKTLNKVKASAQREVAYLESVVAKVDKTVKADFTDAVNRLKNLF